MRIKSTAITIISVLAGILLWVPGVAAHHGWNWTEDKQTEMTGIITEIFIGPPHPRLMIETDTGPWQVDLGNPRQTRNAGFVEGEAKTGDKVLILGHRSANKDEHIIKAVRATINSKQYTFYPDLLREN